MGSLEEEFKSSFEALGYYPISGVPVVTKGDVWYRRNGASDLVGNFGFLRFQPKAKAYDVRVGVVDFEAMDLLKVILPNILKYLHPAVARSSIGFFNYPCWTLFSPGRALNPVALSIPHPLSRPSWPTRLEQLVSKFLEPVFWPIEDAKGCVDLLLRNEIPFEWSVSGPIVRVAELIALSKTANVESAKIKKSIMEFDRVISLSAYGSPDSEKVVDEFLNLIY